MALVDIDFSEEAIFNMSIAQNYNTIAWLSEWVDISKNCCKESQLPPVPLLE